MTVRLCQVLPLQLQSLSGKVEGLFLSPESAVQAQTPKAAADSGCHLPAASGDTTARLR